MTRYEFFRRRIAPVLFLGMVGLIAYDSCEQDQRTHTTFVLDLGDAAPEVRKVDAELIVGGDVIASFHRAALPDSAIGPCTFETAMPEDRGELRIEVDVAGQARRMTRIVQAVEGSTTTIRLGDDLR